MTRARFERKIPAALGLGLALTLPISASAQPGPGLSSGTGQGTGTGTSSGIQRNQSGSVSGVGPGGEGGQPRFRSGTGFRPQPRSGFSVDMGPGVDTTFPDDTTLFPFAPGGAQGRTSPPDLSTVQPRELEFARSIADPADRSLTLHKVANVAIFSNQLDLAHQALGEGASAALTIQDPVVRDLRLVALINALNNLGEAHLREGKMDLSAADLGDEPPTPLPEKSAPVDRNTLISRAEVEWRRGAYLSERITNPTYKNEMLFRVADNQAFGSQTVVNEFPHEDTSTQRASTAATPDALDRRADQLLVGAAAIGTRIGRPVWRDRALVAVAGAAAQSRQFARGLQVARMIPQPEVRTDALVRIAEAQARGNDPNGATSTYQEAARAVASIPLDDPRAVLAGVLIDNLISVGRFEDARRIVVLYPDNDRRLLALGAIAESQGFRGAAQSAVEWIRREVPPEHQPFLYRRLRFGTLAAIEQNRSRSLEPGGMGPGGTGTGTGTGGTGTGTGGTGTGGGRPGS